MGINMGSISGGSFGMLVGAGGHNYEWIDGWARVPDSENARGGWAHPGIAVTEGGNIVTYHPGDPTVLIFDPDGNLLTSWDSGVLEGHGITTTKDGDTEYLWIADNGVKNVKETGYRWLPKGKMGQVVKMTLDGQRVMKLAPPDLPVYRDGEYLPTSVAVNEGRHDGNGDVWVADGYGMSYVHRFDKGGGYLSSINGEEGDAGRLNEPHAVFIDRRKPEPELYISDRSNKRVQVYDLKGNFKRAFGNAFLNSPSGFVTFGEFMVVAELRARLVVLDLHDSYVCELGKNEQVCNVVGWPNSKRGDEIVPTVFLEAGKFNSPHGMAIDAHDNLYVAEWLIGGRVTKLAKR